MHSELFDELRDKGFAVHARRHRRERHHRGHRPAGAADRARGCILATSAVVEITGLRNPCVQLDTFQKGLMAATLDRDDDGT